MGYMCHQVFVASVVNANSERDAARYYAVSSNVLKRLRRLTSEKGNPDEARKPPRDGGYQPFTAQEKKWIEETVKTLTRRAGERPYKPEAELPQITMDDLPSLE